MAHEEGTPTRWDGGRIRYSKDGEAVYILREQHRGHRYQFKLDVTNEDDALVELRLFRRDPQAYAQRHKAEHAPIEREDRLVLNADLIGEFEDYLRGNNHKAPGAGCSDRYIADARRYLDRWMEWLLGRDLRDVKAKEALRWLAKGTARQKRVSYIKALGTWLQATGQWERADNWTAEIPSQKSGTIKDAGATEYQAHDVEELYRRLDDQKYRDILQLLARFGLHYTELVRFAQGGRMGGIEALENTEPITAALSVWHKNQKRHVILVDRQAEAAARRLQKLERMPTVDEVRRKFLRACGYIVDSRQKNKIVGKRDDALPQLVPKKFRHTFLTIGRRHAKKVPFRGHQGLSLEDLTVVTGHSTKVAKQNYDLGQMPPHMVVMPMKLKHPDDPSLALLQAS